MQECGPRFTLKLKSLQHGTFDTKGGEYEWVHKVLYLLTSIAVLNISCPAKHFSYILTAWLSLYSLSSFAFSRKWTQVEGGFSCDLVLELCILDCMSAGIWLIWWMLVILKFWNLSKYFYIIFCIFIYHGAVVLLSLYTTPINFDHKSVCLLRKNLHFALIWDGMRNASNIEIFKFNISLVHWCCYSFVTSLGVIELISHELKCLVLASSSLHKKLQCDIIVVTCSLFDAFLIKFLYIFTIDWNLSSRL